MYNNISFLNILAFFLITIAYSLDSQATKYIGIILMLVALIFEFYMLFKRYYFKVKYEKYFCVIFIVLDLTYFFFIA